MLKQKCTQEQPKTLTEIPKKTNKHKKTKKQKNQKKKQKKAGIRWFFYKNFGGFFWLFFLAATLFARTFSRNVQGPFHLLQ